MIDRLQVAVRLRAPFEAADVGLRLLRAHWKPVYAVTLVLLAPLALALGGLFRAHPWVMPLAIWWLKPLWDRPILHVLGRATFGETPGVASTLKALPGLFRRGLLASLLWRRLSDVRSLVLPIWQLEGQGGAAYRRRRAVLVRRGRFQAGLLTFACFLFQVVFFVGLFAALELFVPRGSSFSPADKAFEGDAALRSAWVDLLLQSVPVLAMAFIEPFYVAGGFGLYLNRRVELEGWDIELAFRKLGARLATLAQAMMLLLALVLPLAAQGPSEAKVRARAELEEVHRQPEFQTRRTKEGWHWKQAKETNIKARPEWLESLLKALSSFGRAFVGLGTLLKWAIILAAAALIAAFLWRYRRAFAPEPRKRKGEAPPTVLFGMDLRPESLPADVAGTALDFWRRGEARAALALLYRASLSELVGSFQLDLPRGATEGECLRASRAVLPPEGADYFGRLTRAWQGEAYAGRRPMDGESLCLGWASHFRGRR